MDEIERRVERLERAVVLLAEGRRLSDADDFTDAGDLVAPVAELCSLIDDIRATFASGAHET